MEQFLRSFGISEVEKIDPGYYEAAKHAMEQHGNAVMDFADHGCFTYMKEPLTAIRDKLLEDPRNVLYCWLLREAIRADDAEAVGILFAPHKEQKSEFYDSLAIFALVDCVPDMMEQHKALGIPEEITRDTCAMFENQVQDFIDLQHRYGISDYGTWMLKFVRSRLIRLGRFNFELLDYEEPYDVFERNGELAVLPNGVTFHKSGRVLGSIDCEDPEGSFHGTITETDAYYEGLKIENGLCLHETVRLAKSEWKPVVTKGDRVVGVHIPSGEALTPEICDRDLARAREIIPRCFGPFKAFYTESWLLDPQIKPLFGKVTNLTRFHDRFTVYPRLSDGTAMFSYVFWVPADTPTEELPESSSFAKAVKQHLLNGGHIYDTNGVFL